MKTAKYYDQEDSVNKACLEFTKYHRYYVFKKQYNAKSVIYNKEKTKNKTKEPVKRGRPKKEKLIDKYLSNRTNVLDI